MDTILVINAGSSSLKFQAFGANERGGLARLIKGQIDGVGTSPRLKAEDGQGAVLVSRSYAREEAADLHAATGLVGTWLRSLQGYTLVAAGHRVVHGGPTFAQPVLVDETVVGELERFVSLAPLHQPNNLAPIRTLLKNRPELPQVACFDTAFHRGHPAIADRYALPENLYAEGVRRYGFHGLSYEYIAGRLPEIAPDVAHGRVIVAHLGSGASMCALARGRSVESTLGFSALDGLPMGTRPGQLDPAIIVYLFQKGMSIEAVQKFLYQECGLKGLSGISNDMRTLEASSDPRAAFALDYFAYRVGLNAGMLAASLGGIDAFVFTAGIGENSASMRARICERLAWLGVELDAAANADRAQVISSTSSRVPVYVIPTDEELMIARHTWALLSDRSLVASDEKRSRT
jgi:acetate kinase